MGRIIFDDNMHVLSALDNDSVDLVYIDPPFNTGRTQAHTRIKSLVDENGDRTGFQGKRYRTEVVSAASFADSFDDFNAFLRPRLEQAIRILKPNGSFFLHIDYREVHYCKVLLDALFGRDCFMNEIIWAYDFGGRPKRRWPAKHDNILWYVMNPKEYTFNQQELPRIPYMAPGLVTPEKALRGKTPTDVWWHTIVPTAGKERTGYPTQKPLGVVERIVKVHSRPGALLLDFFAGSGTLGEAAARHGRDFILVDSNPQAVQTMARRLAFTSPECVGFQPESPLPGPLL